MNLMLLWNFWFLLCSHSVSDFFWILHNNILLHWKKKKKIKTCQCSVSASELLYPTGKLQDIPSGARLCHDYFIREFKITLSLVHHEPIYKLIYVIIYKMLMGVQTEVIIPARVYIHPTFLTFTLLIPSYS